MHFIWKFCALRFAFQKVHTFWDSAPWNPDKLADLSRPFWSCFSSTWLILSQKLKMTRLGSGHWHSKDDPLCSYHGFIKGECDDVNDENEELDQRFWPFSH